MATVAAATSPAHAAPAHAAAKRVTVIPKSRHIPERSCVACGRKAAKGELLRVVCTPAGAVAIDRTGRQNGRGAYLCRQAGCWEKALTRRSLERTLRRPVSDADVNLLKQNLIETFASAAANRTPGGPGPDTA